MHWALYKKNPFKLSCNFFSSSSFSRESFFLFPLLARKFHFLSPLKHSIILLVAGKYEKKRQKNGSELRECINIGMFSKCLCCGNWWGRKNERKLASFTSTFWRTIELPLRANQSRTFEHLRECGNLWVRAKFRMIKYGDLHLNFKFEPLFSCTQKNVSVSS